MIFSSVRFLDTVDVATACFIDEVAYYAHIWYVISKCLAVFTLSSILVNVLCITTNIFCLLSYSRFSTISRQRL